MEKYPKVNIPIREWAEEDRPREKLILKGKSALSDAELLAILIGSGNRSMSAVELSKYVLKEVGNDLNALAKLTLSDLKKFNGIGEAKALTIISALELGRRRRESTPSERIKITCSMDTYQLMRPHFMDLRHEEFWLVMLNRANVVIAKNTLSTGGISGTIADIRLIFKTALENLASTVILVHNHPSGNKQPSNHDFILTKKALETGKLMEIPVLDHLIITDIGYYSFADEGRLV